MFGPGLEAVEALRTGLAAMPGEHHTLDRRLQDTDAIRTYCDVLEQQIEVAEVDEPERERATAWLAWARAHAAEIDPFRTLPTMPEAPEFTPKALEAFKEESDVLGPEWKSAPDHASLLQNSYTTWLHLPAQKSFFRGKDIHV